MKRDNPCDSKSLHIMPTATGTRWWNPGSWTDPNINTVSSVTYKGSTYNSVSEMRFKVMPSIEKVIFNPPATIVLWVDGTKTVAKAKETGKGKERDKFSEEYGLAMAIAKKFFGSRGAFMKNVENAKRCGR